MRRYRKFSETFRRKVVLDYVEDRVSLRELSRRHAIGRNLILIWAKRYEPGKFARRRSRRKLLRNYERRIVALEIYISLLTQQLGTAATV
jgi:transposase-like protein